jgi:hypothetical protein
VVTVVALEQQRELDSSFARADLAIASREVELRNGVLSGTVHNLGSADVDDAVIAVVTKDGASLHVSLALLSPRIFLKRSFTCRFRSRCGGLRLPVDPDSSAEIYEGNNETT